jgi:hypothetical protein
MQFDCLYHLQIEGRPAQDFTSILSIEARWVGTKDSCHFRSPNVLAIPLPSVASPLQRKSPPAGVRHVQNRYK